MPAERVALVDTSLFGHLRMLGENGCDLLDFIIECHGEHAEGDATELGRIDYCTAALKGASIGDHGVSDADAMTWYSQLEAGEAEALRKLFNDGADLKLLIRAIKLKGSEMLLTCDRRLLNAAARYALQHRCFKAAVAYTDDWLDGGVRNMPEYGTDLMESVGNDPFFHYANRTRCPACDPQTRCKANVANTG